MKEISTGTKDSYLSYTTCDSHGSFNQEGIHEQPSSNKAVNITPAAQCSSSISKERIEMEINPGVLTVETASKWLSNLGLSATGLHHAYQILSVPVRPVDNPDCASVGQNLNDVSILCNYIHLQKLELPNNKIKDLSCVSHMPYLIILDASHNELSDYFEFQPPKNLKEVNFSHNKMSKMKELSAYSSLSKLNLDYNHFSEICGLEHCASLTHLSLAHNKIFRISGLDNLPLRELCLRGNKLKKIERLESLRTLQDLDLSLNQIPSASGLQTLHFLGSLNLERNLISDIKDASHLHDLFLLRKLNLQSNPVQGQPDYRLALIFLLEQLTQLDQEKVTAEEKVYSINKYDPPLEVVAARDHMTHVVYHLTQPQVLYDSTLPSLDSPYPMLVLTGPQACGKRELAHKLCFEFSNYFGYGACHTTRSPYFGEENGWDYHFVTEEAFQSMILMGEFVETMSYGGHQYGLSRSCIEEVAREGLACCVHMELEGVFSLKNSTFEPRYVLLIPTDVEQYNQRLERRNLYTHSQMDIAVGRIELYARTNRNSPGFFDDVICCDDPAEAYQTLRQVVKDYMGLDEHRDQPTSTDDTAIDLPKETLAESKVTVTSFSGSESGFRPLPVPTIDPTDCHDRNYQSKVQTQLTTQRTSAELASICRRERLIREALVGKSPGAYSQLFKRSAQTAPSSLAAQIQDPSLSLTTTLKGTLKDSSSDESGACSASSLPSSAGALGMEPSTEPLDGSILGHTPDMLKCQMEPGRSPVTLSSEKMATHRPGSNVKPVLPPIPSGRKTPA